MDIGKNVGALNGLFNGDSNQALRLSINSVRKPQFDANSINGGHDGGGWWIDGVLKTDDELKHYVDKAEPFSVLPDYRNPGSYTGGEYKVNMMVRDGQWHRVVDPTGGVALDINTTLSSQFEKKHDTDAEDSYAHWWTTVTLLDDNSVYWFYLELRKFDFDPDLNGLDPDRLVLKYFKEAPGGPDPDTDPYVQDKYGETINSIRILARVKITSGVIAIWQYHLHNIKDCQTTPDAVAYGTEIISDDPDTLEAYIATLDYQTNDEDDNKRKNCLQDYQAAEQMLISDDIMEFDGDRGIAYYDLVKEDGIKKIKKQYSRLDTHNAAEHLDSGYSLEVVPSSHFSQLYHFYSPSGGTDVETLTDFSTLKFDSAAGTTTLLGRHIRADGKPKLHYIEFKNMDPSYADYYNLSSVTIPTGGSVEILTFPTLRTKTTEVDCIAGSALLAFSIEGIYEIHGRVVVSTGTYSVADFSGNIIFGLFSVNADTAAVTFYTPTSEARMFVNASIGVTSDTVTLNITHYLKHCGTTAPTANNLDMRLAGTLDQRAVVGMYCINNSSVDLKADRCEITAKRLK